MGDLSFGVTSLLIGLTSDPIATTPTPRLWDTPDSRFRVYPLPYIPPPHAYAVDVYRDVIILPAHRVSVSERPVVRCLASPDTVVPLLPEQVHGPRYASKLQSA